MYIYIFISIYFSMYFRFQNISDILSFNYFNNIYKIEEYSIVYFDSRNLLLHKIERERLKAFDSMNI